MSDHTTPGDYAQFEALLAEHPDDAWNLAFNAGAHKHRFVASLTEPEDYQEQAKSIVRAYAQEHLDKSDTATEPDVYVVWFAKTLRNWKALISTSLPDGKYYEVTHNGAEQETYLDAYVKLENRVVR